MSSLAHHAEVGFLRLDVHKDSVSAGILIPGHDSADVERIFNDEESGRRLIGRFFRAHTVAGVLRGTTDGL